MTDAIQVVTTAGSKQEADRIAEALVEQRLVACAQVSGPITSTYHWHSKVETAQEWRCTVKTLHSHYRAVEAAIRQVHSYDEPEILATSVVAASPGYLDWLSGELADPSGPGTT
jgi:periplasmic divalent cation tolerance protein